VTKADAADPHLTFEVIHSSCWHSSALHPPQAVITEWLPTLLLVILHPTLLLQDCTL
jgi:hypothetical protein